MNPKRRHEVSDADVDKLVKWQTPDVIVIDTIEAEKELPPDWSTGDEGGKPCKPSAYRGTTR